MFKKNLFEPMQEEVQNILDFSFKYSMDHNFHIYKPIVIKRRSNYIPNKFHYGKLLFGFDPSEYNTEIF